MCLSGFRARHSITCPPFPPEVGNYSSHGPGSVGSVPKFYNLFKALRLLYAVANSCAKITMKPAKVLLAFMAAAATAAPFGE